MASSSEPELDPNVRRGFVPPRDDAERLLMRRVEELCARAEGRGMPQYTGFLCDREQDLAQAAANRAGCTFARFWGGYAGAERKVLCLEPPDTWQEEPVAALHLSWNAAAPAPGHRDILGAILGLGLERTAVGDILLAPGGAEAWVLATADKAGFIAAELAAAGRCPLHAELCAGLPAAALTKPERELRQATVPALRADAVLGAMLRAPRTHAAQLINAGRVSVDHLPLHSAHEQVYAGDIFTVQGTGRFQLQSIGGKSKKDRIFIEFYQF